MNYRQSYLFADSGQRQFANILALKYKASNKIFILTDENTKKYCLKKFLKDFPILQDAINITIPAGEAYKKLESCHTIWKVLLDNVADRNAFLINLGGGMITDMGGFCASVFKRGIHFCHVPTTLLGMADASIGGKTGINFFAYKNIIGTFSFPEVTYIDNAFLKTLPSKHLMTGYAEMLKTAIISDKKLWLEFKYTKPDVFKSENRLIKKVVEIKNSFVENDPYEKNIRKSLNFGHTIGHALETYSLLFHKKNLSHGEAIAAGMICEAYISTKSTGFPSSSLNDICSIIYSNFKKIKPKFDKKKLMSLMYKDKKNKNKEINFTLLKDIGEFVIDCYPGEPIIDEALDFYFNT